MLYTEFFGLSERPFTLVPDPDFLYWSQEHMRAYTVLEYGILTRAPITLLTGEIGAGKTTLVQALLRETGDDVTVGLVSNARGGRGELISWVLSAFGIESPPGAAYVDMHHALETFLLKEYAAGRRAVIIFDEAQNLTSEGIEEVRLLTNINSGKDELVQLVLVGQPELRDMISAPDMRQIAQRVAASFHLTRMDPEGVHAYISHRMRHAGGDGGEFTDGACAAIHTATQGVPRLVNQMADMALVYAWSEGARQVTERTVKDVSESGLFFWNAETATGGDPDPAPNTKTHKPDDRPPHLRPVGEDR